MDLLQLEYFLAVARTENMTAAAASLHVAQSSVSRCISRLESSLGVPLFDRSGHGIALNEYGRSFYQRAETILREMNDGERELKEMWDQQIGRVSISTSASRQINQLILRHMAEHPEVLFRQRRCTNIDEIKAMLDSGALDFALTYLPLSDQQYEWTPLIQERYYLMVPAAHPLADKPDISLQVISQERLFVNYSDDPDRIEAQFADKGVKPQFGFIGDEFELLGPMVEHGLGVCLVSALALYELKQSLPFENLSRIRVIRIQEEGLTHTLGILSRKHHYMSSTAREFRQKLITYFKEIQQELP